MRLCETHLHVLVSSALYTSASYFTVGVRILFVYLLNILCPSLSHKERRSADPADKHHKAWRLSVYVQRTLFKWKLLPLLPHAVFYFYLSSLPRVAGAGY